MPPLIAIVVDKEKGTKLPQKRGNFQLKLPWRRLGHVLVATLIICCDLVVKFSVVYDTSERRELLNVLICFSS